MQQSEVLVHISAPSTVGDDASYRAQVEAILGFQPFSRQVITLRSDDSDPVPTATEAGPSYTQGPHNASSSTPRPPDPGATSSVQRQRHHDKDSLETPLSVIPDSQPERIPLEPVDLQEIALPQSSTSRRKSTDTNGLPPPTKRSCLDVPSLVTEQARNNTPPSDERLNNDKSPNNTTTTTTTKEEVIRTSKDNTVHLPLEIKPNPPPISANPFTTHITPTLKMLSIRLNPSRTYTPINQTRPLDNLERGHWYLRLNLSPNPNSTSSSTWEMPFFIRFWTFLTDFIAKEGRAGWGVWCLLEDNGSDKPANGLEDGGDETTTRPVILKVYAWGEIASHIYLLLFLASERRVRRMGLQWRDSADEVVIQMP
ncbi:hypothetical protein CBS147346_6981 [Aspergillus niger]|nr:hypothetical protein CBS147346_6981 [Aspergillus niger]